MPDIGEPKWVYLSSLGEQSLAFHEEMANYFDAHPSINLVFQPGTFQIKLGAEKLSRIYKRTKIFFCNVEEAQKILGETSREVRVLAEKIHELGPEIVCITDGPDGAYAYSANPNGGELWFIPQYPDPAPPVDRTGAGDAFSSTFAIAIALGKSIPEALSWGPINSMSVVQYFGAQEGLLSRGKLEEYLANAPADYKPRLVS
jgi:sugar/nucleoside kinase (ribokinase family)